MSQIQEEKQGNHGNQGNYFNLEIATISKCNMACTYCFEGEELQTNKKQTKENIPDIINKVEALLDNEKFNKEYPSGICINLWGGEPSLNFDWNKELIDTLKDKNYYHKITFFMYSNGYSYNKISNHIDLFTEYELLQNKFRLQISWDGIDNGRINHKKEATTEKVKNHILTFALMYPYLNITTKATIQPSELLQLEEIWNQYFLLYKQSKKKPNRLNVNFSPTLNYVDDFDDQDPNYLNQLKIQFGKVSKLEKAFYSKYNHHLFGWFSETQPEARGKRLTNCSAGINLLAVDYNGQISSCHGTLYSPMKKEFEEFHNMNIKEDTNQFINKFFISREELRTHHSYVANSCITCEATICYKCPVVNIEQLNYLKPENFQIRDTRHCSIYKLFGKFDRIQLSEKQLSSIKEN